MILRLLRLAVALLLAANLSGCATPYQSRGFGGGFSETQINERTFMVRFRGNGYTSAERASDLLLLRAAELTLQRGFNSFVINESADTSVSRTTVLPSVTTTTGQATVNPYAPGVANYSQTSFTNPGGSYRTRKPRVQITVVMLSGEDARRVPLGSTVYAARLIRDQLRRQYNLDRPAPAGS